MRLPELESVLDVRVDGQGYAKPGVVVGIVDQPSVMVRHADGTKSQYALSVVRRDLEPAADLSEVSNDVLVMELRKRRAL